MLAVSLPICVAFVACGGDRTLPETPTCDYMSDTELSAIISPLIVSSVTPDTGRRITECTYGFSFPIAGTVMDGQIIVEVYRGVKKLPTQIDVDEVIDIPGVADRKARWEENPPSLHVLVEGGYLSILIVADLDTGTGQRHSRAVALRVYETILPRLGVGES